MISYHLATQNDLDQILEVINDVSIKIQEESRSIIIVRISQNQMLCILDNNKIIGFIGWITNYRENPEFLFIEQITIKNTYRNRGIGQNTIRYFLNMSKEFGYKKIFAEVEPHNKPSMNMFIKTGWKNSELNSTSDDILIEHNLI